MKFFFFFFKVQYARCFQRQLVITLSSLVSYQDSILVCSTGFDMSEVNMVQEVGSDPGSKQTNQLGVSWQGS